MFSFPGKNNSLTYRFNNIKLGDNYIQRVYLGGPLNLLSPNRYISETLQVSTNNYNCAWITLAEPIEIKAGDKFIFSVENINVLEGNPTKFAVCLFNYKAAGDAYGQVSNFTHITKEKPYCILTSIKDITLYTLILYAGLNGATAGNSVTFEKLMLIKGDTPAYMEP